MSIEGSKGASSMAYDVPADLAEKVAIMREFGRRRAAGEPVSEELQAKHVNATNDNYTTGPEPGERIPDFRPTRCERCFAIAHGSHWAQWLAAGVSSQRGLVTIQPLPTGRVGTIPFNAGEEWRPDRSRQL